VGYGGRCNGMSRVENSSDSEMRKPHWGCLVLLNLLFLSLYENHVKLFVWLSL
jgi:hypothetical protein